jgi:uncharacterized protein YlxW (UPF0749 family)
MRVRKFRSKKYYKNRLVEEIDCCDALCDENEKFAIQILNLKEAKAGLIEYVKKLRLKLNFAENEIKRLQNENEMLKNNINSLMITYQENDTALMKAINSNSLLAGKVEAYERCLKDE